MGTFTDQEKADIRKFCGFGEFGALAGQGFAYRFFTAFGNMEYRLNNSLPEEEANIRAQLVNLRTLEAAIPTASANLDTDQAAVWIHNKNEIGDRWRLFNSMRRYLCGTIGIKPGPHLGSGVRRVVV